MADKIPEAPKVPSYNKQIVMAVMVLIVVAVLIAIFIKLFLGVVIGLLVAVFGLGTQVANRNKL